MISTRSQDALVLGGAGFIGRRTCLALSLAGFRVTALGHGELSEATRTDWGIDRWLEGDIDSALIARALAGSTPSVCIHTAGSGSVAASYATPLGDFRRTVDTTVALLDAVRGIDESVRPRIVLASSAAVYGDQGDVDLSESGNRSPMSPYGFSKVAAESMCDSYSRFFGVEVSIVRLFSVYGDGLRKQLLWDAMNKFARGESEFFGTGNELRDWIHVDDAASLLVSAGTAPQSSFEIYNGGHEKATIRHVLELLFSKVPEAREIRFNGATHSGNPRRLTADSRHTRRQLGWKPKVQLSDGLSAYAEWFLAGAPT